MRGASIGGNMIPRLVDEVPALTIASIFAGGKSVVRDASELRVKETDRIASIASEFGKLGAQIDTESDGLSVRGGTSLTGGLVDSWGDHRLAMSLAVAGLLLPEGQAVEIINSQCADVSYPGFWDDLDRVRA